MIYIHNADGTSVPLCRYQTGPTWGREVTTTYVEPLRPSRARGCKCSSVDKYEKVATAKRRVYVEENLDVYYNEYRDKYKFVNTKDRFEDRSWFQLK